MLKYNSLQDCSSIKKIKSNKSGFFKQKWVLAGLEPTASRLHALGATIAIQYLMLS